MLSSNNLTNLSSDSTDKSLIPCWSVLESALNQLFPSPENLGVPSQLCSDDYLKLYTLVFEHCVGSVDSKKTTTSGSGKVMDGLNFSGEELYMTLVKYLEIRFDSWSNFISNQISNSFQTLAPIQSYLDLLLVQLDRLQLGEKPLTFIFTYLERHWIIRQINESRLDILPMKQLIWSRWDEIVLKKFWPLQVLPQISFSIASVRSGSKDLESLENVARFVHYLRVISKPTQLESDYKATRKVIMAGAVTNSSVRHNDRFKEFIKWYCEGLNSDSPQIPFDSFDLSDFIKVSLQFWNDEEGRMSFLKFDKVAQVTIRNHLKNLLLIPNLELIKESFHKSILTWNILEANSIFRLLSNRKSLLIQLDSVFEASLIEKGRDLLKSNSIEDDEHFFINLLGQYYNLSSELIKTSFASRLEFFESRSKAFRSLLNNRKGFSARCLAKFSDYIIRNYPDSSEENLKVLMALFRLIDDKDDFQETFGILLSIRLLSESTKLPSKFEKDLLSELKKICGNFYTKSFEKMFSDIMEREDERFTIITGGVWNIRGKLLPGNNLFIDLDHLHSKSPFPQNIHEEIIEKSKKYHKNYPKRKLFFSPLLSSIEFNFTLDSGSIILIKGNIHHYNLLKELSDNPSIDLFNNYDESIINCFINSQLISREGEINHNYSGDSFVNLYNVTLNELGFIGSTNGNNLITNNRCTPSPYFTSTSNNNYCISPIDKSILLQCSITRLLKQLRSLSLSDLFSRISMLPKLLTRFSPTQKDVLDAIKQLHEKEFVQLVLGDGIDDIIEVSENDLKNLDNFNNNLFIKYLA